MFSGVSQQGASFSTKRPDEGVGHVRNRLVESEDLVTIATKWHQVKARIQQRKQDCFVPPAEYIKMVEGQIEIPIY